MEKYHELEEELRAYVAQMGDQGTSFDCMTAEIHLDTYQEEFSQKLSKKFSTDDRYSLRKELNKHELVPVISDGIAYIFTKKYAIRSKKVLFVGLILF